MFKLPPCPQRVYRLRATFCNQVGTLSPELFFPLTPVLLRKARPSKKADSQYLDANLESSPVDRRLLSDQDEEASFRSESQAPRTDHLNQPPHARRGRTFDNWHERRREQSVLADLGGSESAMDITKKVRRKFKPSDVIANKQRQDLGVRKLPISGRQGNVRDSRRRFLQDDGFEIEGWQTSAYLADSWSRSSLSTNFRCISRHVLLHSPLVLACALRAKVPRAIYRNYGFWPSLSLRSCFPAPADNGHGHGMLVRP